MVLERLQKIIAEAGVCSRRKAEDLIHEGKVILNSKVATIGQSADVETDSIFVNGREIEKQNKCYYLLHKPKNYITTSDDLYERKKVIDLVPNKPLVFAVGRLDRDTSGILILTNDGEFANKIMHPRYEVEKTYIVTLDENFDKKLIPDFEKGIYIDKQKVTSKLKIIDSKTIEIKLHTGIHKIVKRLFKEKGYYVKNLIRTHIGKLKLDIPVSHFRNLTERDKKLIFES